MDNSQKLDKLKEAMKDALAAGNNNKALKALREVMKLLPSDSVLMKERVTELMQIER